MTRLRIVVICNKGSDSEKTIWQACPSLIKRAKIISFLPLSEDSLLALAKSQLDEDILKENSNRCVQLYRNNGWNPAQFYFLIDAYKSIHNSKKDELSSREIKLRSGLQKLKDASKTVKELEKEVEQQGIELKEKRADADAALDAIQTAMSGAETTKEDMKIKQKNAAKERENI